MLTLAGARCPIVALPEAVRVLEERPNQPTVNPMMRCPCGSTKPADMMIDVEAEGGVFTVPFVCTTCVKHQRRLGNLCPPPPAGAS